MCEPMTSLGGDWTDLGHLVERRDDRMVGTAITSVSKFFVAWGTQEPGYSKRLHPAMAQPPQMS